MHCGSLRFSTVRYSVKEAIKLEPDESRLSRTYDMEKHPDLRTLSNSLLNLRTASVSPGTLVQHAATVSSDCLG